jgi:NMD protein affecting ribosome stability and mRNA decay
MAKDIRKGDIVNLHGGKAEVLSVVANNEGGLDIVLRYAETRKELSRTVLRRGGPDERKEDKKTHSDDYDSPEVVDEEEVEDEVVEDEVVEDEVK